MTTYTVYRPELKLIVYKVGKRLVLSLTGSPDDFEKYRPFINHI